MEPVPVAACLTALLSVLASGLGLLRRGEVLQPDDSHPASAFSLRPEAVREWQGRPGDKPLGRDLLPWLATVGKKEDAGQDQDRPFGLCVLSHDTNGTAVVKGIYRLVTYIFVYEDVISLVCGAVIIWYFAGSFEKNVGSVKHCFLTAVFAILSALVYLALRAAVSGWFGVADAEGFAPVAFAMLSASIACSQMRRTLFFGINFPVALLPWLLLGAACLIPRTSLLGNFCGLLIGKIYGYGYCCGLDLPESTVSRMDQKFPFQLLRRIPGLKYIPGSLAERRACLSRKLNPAPGSYPTQSCPSSPPPPAFPILQMQQPSHHTPGLWSQHPPGLPYIPAPSQAVGALGASCNPNHFHAPLGGPSALSSQRWGGPHLWGPSGTGRSEASVPQVPGFPSGSADLCQVHVN